MRIGKHTEAGQKIEQLESTIKRKDREIYEVKQECASAFKEIYELSKGNSFDNDRAIKSRMGEIAKDNFNLLFNDLIDYEHDCKNKIIELPTRQSK